MEIIEQGKPSEKVSYKDMEFEVDGKVTVIEDSSGGEKIKR